MISWIWLFSFFPVFENLPKIGGHHLIFSIIAYRHFSVLTDGKKCAYGNLLSHLWHNYPPVRNKLTAIRIFLIWIHWPLRNQSTMCVISFNMNSFAFDYQPTMCYLIYKIFGMYFLSALQNNFVISSIQSKEIVFSDFWPWLM